MRIKQISVFVSNEPGHLVNVLKPLFHNQINIRALSVADTTDFGIIRIVASDTEGAVKALHAAGFTLQVNELLAYDMPNVPGGLLKAIVEPLAEAGINLEYFYAFLQNEAGQALVVLKVNEPEKAERTLKGARAP